MFLANESVFQQLYWADHKATCVWCTYYFFFYVFKLQFSWYALLETLLVAVIFSRFLDCKWEISFCWRFIRAELIRQIKRTVTKTFRYQFMAPVHTNLDMFETTYFFTLISRGWMSGFTDLMLTKGHFVIKNMFSFRNIQIPVDRALMFNTTLYM